jgi:hypothetical protein
VWDSGFAFFSLDILDSALATFEWGSPVRPRSFRDPVDSTRLEVVIPESVAIRTLSVDGYLVQVETALLTGGIGLHRLPFLHAVWPLPGSRWVLAQGWAKKARNLDLIRDMLSTVRVSAEHDWDSIGRDRKISMRSTLALLGFLLVPGSAQSQQPDSGYVPPAGFVPDSATAVRIAVAVWIPIYGKRQIMSEAPFVASLENGVWTVTGSLPPAPKGMMVVGGAAIVRIARRDGRILFLTHYQWGVLDAWTCRGAI